MLGVAPARRRIAGALLAAGARAPRLPLTCPQQRCTISFKMFDNLIPEDDPATKAAKEKEARIIRAKMQRSKFAEASAAGREKLFVATAAVAPPTADRLFPAMAPSTPLVDGAGGPAALPSAFSRYPVTLVTIAFQGMGQAQLPAWHEAFLARYSPGLLGGAADAAGAGGLAPSGGGGARVGLLNVIFLEGFIWRFLKGLIRGGLRRSLQPAQVAGHSVIAVETSEKAADHFCDALGIHNRVMGHVFLVDAGGHVRWRAHSTPQDGELQALYDATDLLLKHAKR